MQYAVCAELRTEKRKRQKVDRNISSLGRYKKTSTNDIQQNRINIHLTIDYLLFTIDSIA